MNLPAWVADLTPSDWTMFVFAALLLFFVVDYGLFTPWWKSPVSFFVFEYGVAMLALMYLVIHGVIMGQRVDEWARELVWLGLAVGVAGKIIMVKVLRRQGRIERRRLAGLISERNRRDPKTEAVADATEIWYKGKRVLRTAFATLITLLPLAPQVLAIVNEQWSSEWLIAVGAQAVALNSVITRIMAIPVVNAWLIKVGLGSVPASAVLENPRTNTVIVKADEAVADRA